MAIDKSNKRKIVSATDQPSDQPVTAFRGFVTAKTHEPDAKHRLTIPQTGLCSPGASLPWPDARLTYNYSGPFGLAALEDSSASPYQVSRQGNLDLLAKVGTWYTPRQRSTSAANEF